jgi:putative membrane protein
MIRIALVLASTALISACGMWDRMTGGGERAATGSISPDAQLMRDIAEANLAEITTGKLAVSKAQSSAVKQFGQHMIDEHSKLQSEGVKLASAKKMSVPNAPDPKHQAAAKKLNTLSGDSFDKTYMEQMVKNHTETLQLLQKTVSRAKDPDVRALAQKAMPHVQKHLDMAKSVAGQVGAKAQ